VSDLVVTPFTPALGTGRALRTYGVVRALASLGPIDVLYAVFGDDEPGPEYRAIEDARLHAVRPSRGPRRALEYLAARRDGVPHSFARGVSPELRESAAELAEAPGRGRVVADGPIAAAALRELAGHRPVIYNAQNLESAFRHSLGERGLGSRRTLERFERGLLERFSESWMVSAADLKGALALAPGATLRYVPNAVDVQAIRPAPAAGDARALFVADFTYLPNRNALRFLVDEVLPRVWRELPEARLTVVGRGLDRPPADERVEPFGFVPDLGPVYASAACVVVPLLEGGGSPLKFIEALAFGVPVVATPLAAAGLEAEAGEHYLEAEEPDAFAAAVVRVMREGGAGLADKGRRLVEESYSIEALARVISA
jgi:glycosyltransferase involved in cell wall biosynthesis